MKEPLLLLHGALGTKIQFKALEAKLNDNFEIHSFDFEGHGENESNHEFSMTRFAANVIDYLDKNKIEQIHVFGYSMGGYVALNVALHHPKRIKKIMTLGTKFDWTKASAEAEMKMLNPEKIEEKVPAFAKGLASIHTSNNWKEVVLKTAQMMYGLGTGSKLTSNELSNINHKVLIGIGGKDKMVSIDESKQSADILPQGELMLIEECPHPIEQVNVHEIESIILNFMMD